MTRENCKLLVSSAAALFNAVAALLWWRSARVAKSPAHFPMYVSKSDVPMGGPFGGSYVGNGASPELDHFGAGLNRQSKLSAWAAAFAGLGAVADVLTKAASGNDTDRNVPQRRRKMSSSTSGADSRAPWAGELALHRSLS